MALLEKHRLWWEIKFRPYMAPLHVSYVILNENHNLPLRASVSLFTKGVMKMVLNMVSAHHECSPFSRLGLGLAAETKL